MIEAFNIKEVYDSLHEKIRKIHPKAYVGLDFSLDAHCSFLDHESRICYEYSIYIKDSSGEEIVYESFRKLSELMDWVNSYTLIHPIGKEV